tara:strand:- start:307 stop:1086 length:780 start_codon:yes stop_codon:yes gene_type:complete
LITQKEIKKNYPKVKQEFTFLKLKALLKKPNLRNQFVNFLKYLKRLVLDKKFLNFFYSSSNTSSFYKTWKLEIEKDLKHGTNWRSKDGRKYKNIVDYKNLYSIFNYLSREKQSILDIGSYDGSFIKYYQSFKKIMLSDINAKSDIFPEDKRFKFFQLNGINLKNIPSDSVDVIFSIDTLVRIERKILKIYISDFIRIIKNNGFLIIHIPNIFHYNSLASNFTNTSPYFYKRILKNNTKHIIFDNQLHQMSTFLICQIIK